MKKINLGQKDIIHLWELEDWDTAQIMNNMGFKIQGSDKNKIKIQQVVQRGN